MKIKTIIQNAKILSNRKVKDKYFEIIIYAPEIARYAQPGQFVNIKVNNNYAPLLRRPLSIHRIGLKSLVSSLQSKKNKEIVMLYEVVGKGTEILSQKKEGECLDVIGPLGNGFDYCLPLTAYRLPILVAGGMGAAPLVFLAERLAYSLEPIAYSKNKGSKLSAIPALPAGRRYPCLAGRQALSAKVLIGAKTREDILCEKEFRDLGYNVKIATDDGSRGFKGHVSDLLRKELSRIQNLESSIQIYGCGPAPVLKEISLISQKYNIPAQISLEAHLACGIGVCMGCVIKVKSQKVPACRQAGKVKSEWEYKRVCKEGPVFEARWIT